MFLEKFLNHNKKLIIAVLILSLLYIFPIILANEPFNDDLGRSLSGYRWNMDGRPVASLLFEVLNFSARLTNSAPLPIIIFTTIFVLCMVKFSSEFSGTKSWGNTKKTLFCIIPLLNPFLLENLSYQFDAFQILVLGGNIVLFSNKPSFNKKFLITSTLFLLILIATYQVSISIYLSLVFFEFFFMCLKRYNFKKIIITLALRSLILAFGCFAYFLVVLNFLTLSDYALASSRTLTLNNELLSNIWHNISIFMYMYYDLIKSFKLESIIILLLFIFACLIFSKRVLSSISTKNKYILSILYLLVLFSTPILSALIAILPYCILQEPNISARIMMSFSIILMMLVFPILELFNKKIWILIVLLTLSSYNCSYTYGQTLKHEYEHQNYIAALLSLDLDKYFPDLKYLHFSNSAPLSRWYQLSSTKYPIFTRIIPIYLSKDYFWGYTLLKANFDLVLKNKTPNDFSNFKANQIANSKYYSLYFVDDTAIVEFKN